MTEHATSEGPFLIYTIGKDGIPHHLASCDDDSLGFCLLTLYEEGQIEDRPVGIMHRPNPGLSGDWLVNPYGKKL